MKNRSKTLISIAVAAVFLSGSPASAQQGTPAYNTYFYSDPGYSIQTGVFGWDGCDPYDNPQYSLNGSYGAYALGEHVGYCLNGEMRPF